MARWVGALLLLMRIAMLRQGLGSRMAAACVQDVGPEEAAHVRYFSLAPEAGFGSKA